MEQEQVHPGEFVLSEGNGEISRETVTLLATEEVIAAGTVMSADGDGKYVPFATGAATAAILYERSGVDADVDQQVAVIARDAEVARALLTGLTTESEAALGAVGIIVR